MNDIEKYDWPDRKFLSSPVTLAILDALKFEAVELMNGSISRSTRKNYISDFSTFRSWCISAGLEYSPATVETVVLYLTFLKRSKKYSTIARASTSIHRIYELAKMDSPIDSREVKSILRGIRREIGIACEQTRPLDWQQITKMVECQLPSFIGLRNRALLILGWSGAFRRSELVALNIEDLEAIEEGFVITIRRSKTDQEGQGQKIFIPRNPFAGKICPVEIVKHWIDRLNRNAGPLFVRSKRRNDDFFDSGTDERLSSQSVTFIVKAAAREIGLKPVHYSAHSLRRGFATYAAKLGIPERIISRQTRHVSMSVLRRYIDDGQLTLNNPLMFIYRQHVPRPAGSPPSEFLDLQDPSSRAEPPPKPSPL